MIEDLCENAVPEMAHTQRSVVFFFLPKSDSDAPLTAQQVEASTKATLEM